jgi:hypothetical protein
MLRATTLLKNPDLLRGQGPITRGYRLKLISYRDHLVNRLNSGQLSEEQYNRLEELMLAADRALYGESSGVFKL